MVTLYRKNEPGVSKNNWNISPISLNMAKFVATGQNLVKFVLFKFSVVIMCKHLEYAFMFYKHNV